MSDKPKIYKSFKEFWGDDFVHTESGEIITDTVKDYSEQTWNAAVEATRAEYEDKIKSMQVEIDKRDERIKKLLNHLDNAVPLFVSAKDKMIKGTFEQNAIISEILEIKKELNQRGKDE